MPKKKMSAVQRKRNKTIAEDRRTSRTVVNDDWIMLENLCQQLADAQQNDSWKGGGDPDAIPVIEAELELAKLKLRTHIDAMRRYYEGNQ